MPAPIRVCRQADPVPAPASVGPAVDLVGRRHGLGRRLGRRQVTGLGRLVAGRVRLGQGPRGRRAGDAGRRRLEPHPAVAGEEQLRPGVHVADRHLPGVVPDPLAGQEADRDPRRDADLAGHHRHRGGELLAVAAAIPEQEVLQRSVAAARQRLGAVGEVGAAQELLDRPRLGRVGVGALGHLPGHLLEVLGQIRRQLGGDAAVGRGAGHRSRQRLAARVDVDALHRVREVADRAVPVASRRGQHDQRVRVVRPVAGDGRRCVGRTAAAGTPSRSRAPRSPWSAGHRPRRSSRGSAAARCRTPAASARCASRWRRTGGARPSAGRGRPACRWCSGGRRCRRPG